MAFVQANRPGQLEPQIATCDFVFLPSGETTQMMRTMISDAIGEPPRENFSFKHRALTGFDD